MLRILSIVIALTALTALTGCSAWRLSAPAATPGQSPLRPVDLAADGVALEVLFARFAHGDAELNGTAWNEIDETQLTAALRRELAENGIRAGVVGGQLPPALLRLITAAEQPGNIHETAATLEQPPAVNRQQLNLHSGRRGEIVASGTYPSLSLLTCDAGQCCGQTYAQAQGVLTTKATALGDRRIKLHLTPELRHGEAQQQWIGDDGMFRLQSGKPKRVFEKLSLEATLAPGQMLVLTCLPEKPGTLGHYFFTEPAAGQLQQKLLVVRLAQTRHSDLFAPPLMAEKKSPGGATLVK